MKLSDETRNAMNMLINHLIDDNEKLHKQNEKLKVFVNYLALEGCNRLSEGCNSAGYIDITCLKECYTQNPDYPDMWCYPCRAKKALEEK